MWLLCGGAWRGSMVMMTAGWWWRGGGSSGDDEGGEAAGGLAGGEAAVVMMLVTVGGWCRRCGLAVVAATGQNFAWRGWCGARGEREEREERLGRHNHFHCPEDQVILGETSLLVALDVTHSRVERIRENVAAQRSALIGVWTHLVNPLSVENLVGTASTSDSTPTTIATTTALSLTCIRKTIIQRSVFTWDALLLASYPILPIALSHLRCTPVVYPSNNPHIVPEITITTQTLISSENHQVDTYEECEQALDIDDSDLRLTPVVRPSNKPHIVPEITTTTQTLFSSQNNQVDNCIMKPIRIILGPAEKLLSEVACRDDDFTRAPWLSVLEYVNVDGGIVTGCFGDVKKFLKNGKLKKVVAVFKSCTLNALGDLTVTLKDLSDTSSGTIHYKMLTEERFSKSITIGAALILHNVSVFSPKQSTHHYLNTYTKNIGLKYSTSMVGLHSFYALLRMLQRIFIDFGMS
ncbi:hypothetical protein Tco_0782499 [Tanacetum coccineum]